MIDGNLAGKVQTVLGPIEPGQLGVTMTHEHLLLDLSVVYKVPDTASAWELFEGPVSMETIGRIPHYRSPNVDNYRLLDIPTAIEEVLLYRQHGGDSLVDATSIGLARDPVGLARIWRATGMSVIMGASYYVADTHPPELAWLSEDELAERIAQNVADGVDGTGIKSGIIGEIGCSWPLAENERRVLRASAGAQRRTGAPLLIHPGAAESASSEIIEVLTEAGADPDRIIMGHLDRIVYLYETLRELAETGCYLEWDLFGMEESYFPPGMPGWNHQNDIPNDARRMDDISWVISEGYGRRVLVAHDMCQKYRLEKYGGHGYHYILGHIVPRMRTRGFTQAAIHGILVRNPADALTFAEPRE